MTPLEWLLLASFVPTVCLLCEASDRVADWWHSRKAHR